MASEDELTMTKEELAEWMADNAFTPDSLARVLGVHPVTVRKWCNGTYALKAAGVFALRELAADAKALAARRLDPFADPAAPEKHLAMTGDELIDWMAEYAFDVELLRTTLEVHRVSVTKWRRGKHPIDHVTRLALRWLARDKRAMAARRSAQAAETRAQERVRGSVARAHERAAVATRR